MFHRDEVSFKRFCSLIAYDLVHTEFGSCEIEIKGKKYHVKRDFSDWRKDGIASVRRQIASFLGFDGFADFESVRKALKNRAGFEFTHENLLAKQLHEGTVYISQEQMFDANFVYS